MKILVVGAGAVGQVYGYHLQRGGADVTFFVRDKYVDEMKAGLDLYPLNQREHRTVPVHMGGYGVISQFAEVSASTWDYVVMCTSSTVLGTPWMTDLLAAIGKATLVSLFAGFGDGEELLKVISADRVVWGLITLISFHAPLRAEDPMKPGMAYWFPPMTKAPFSGPPALVKPLLETFRRGGFGCREAGGDKGSAVPGALLSVFVLALEAAGWKFRDFLAAERIPVERAAIREAIEVVCRKEGMKPPWFVGMIGGAFFRMFLFLSRKIIPFDFELYLQIHFTKVRAQMRTTVGRYVSDGVKLGIATPHLVQLQSEAAARAAG